MLDIFGPVAVSHGGPIGGRYAIVLSPDREAPPLEQTLRRAIRFAGSPSHVLVSTTRGRSRDGAERLTRWPGVRWVEQPRDLDTTPGLLLPLLQVLARDPYAWVAVLPSDPAATDDEQFADALVQGMDELVVDPETLVLVDDELPTTPEPPGGEAASLVALARGSSIAELIRRHVPDWWSALTNSFFRPADLDAVYARMAPSSFSRAVLERSASEVPCDARGSRPRRRIGRGGLSRAAPGGPAPARDRSALA